MHSISITLFIAVVLALTFAPAVTHGSSAPPPDANIPQLLSAMKVKLEELEAQEKSSPRGDGANPQLVAFQSAAATVVTPVALSRRCIQGEGECTGDSSPSSTEENSHSRPSETSTPTSKNGTTTSSKSSVVLPFFDFVIATPTNQEAMAFIHQKLQFSTAAYNDEKKDAPTEKRLSVYLKKWTVTPPPATTTVTGTPPTQTNGSATVATTTSDRRAFLEILEGQLIQNSSVYGNIGRSPAVILFRVQFVAPDPSFYLPYNEAMNVSITTADKKWTRFALISMEGRSSPGRFPSDLVLVARGAALISSVVGGFVRGFAPFALQGPASVFPYSVAECHYGYTSDSLVDHWGMRLVPLTFSSANNNGEDDGATSTRNVEFSSGVVFNTFAVVLLGSLWAIAAIFWASGGGAPPLRKTFAMFRFPGQFTVIALAIAPSVVYFAAIVFGYSSSLVRQLASAALLVLVWGIGWIVIAGLAYHANVYYQYTTYDKDDTLLDSSSSSSEEEEDEEEDAVELKRRASSRVQQNQVLLSPPLVIVANPNPAGQQLGNQQPPLLQGSYALPPPHQPNNGLLPQQMTETHLLGGDSQELTQQQPLPQFPASPATPHNPLGAHQHIVGGTTATTAINIPGSPNMPTGTNLPPNYFQQGGGLGMPTPLQPMTADGGGGVAMATPLVGITNNTAHAEQDSVRSSSPSSFSTTSTLLSMTASEVHLQSYGGCCGGGTWQDGNVGDAAGKDPMYLASQQEDKRRRALSKQKHKNNNNTSTKAKQKYKRKKLERLIALLIVAERDQDTQRLGSVINAYRPRMRSIFHMDIVLVLCVAIVASSEDSSCSARNVATTVLFALRLALTAFLRPHNTLLDNGGAVLINFAQFLTAVGGAAAGDDGDPNEAWQYFGVVAMMCPVVVALLYVGVFIFQCISPSNRPRQHFTNKSRFPPMAQQQRASNTTATALNAPLLLEGSDGEEDDSNKGKRKNRRGLEDDEADNEGGRRHHHKNKKKTLVRNGWVDTSSSDGENPFMPGYSSDPDSEGVGGDDEFFIERRNFGGGAPPRGRHHSQRRRGSSRRVYDEYATPSQGSHNGRRRRSTGQESSALSAPYHLDPELESFKADDFDYDRQELPALRGNSDLVKKDGVGGLGDGVESYSAAMRRRRLHDFYKSDPNYKRGYRGSSFSKRQMK